MLENPDTIRIEKVFARAGTDPQGRKYTPETIKRLHEEIEKRVLISKEQFFSYEKSDGTQHRLEDIQGLVEHVRLLEAPDRAELLATVKIIDSPAGKRVQKRMEATKREPELQLLALGKRVDGIDAPVREYTDLRFLGVSLRMTQETGEPA